jgi:hypothetical protein
VQPDDLAQMALFLVSGAASKNAGELIAMSGNLAWEC